MKASIGPSPGSQSHPEHLVAVSGNAGVWNARIGGQEIANSRHTLLVEEPGHAAVVYFPPEDVRLHLLVQSDTESTCPFKGQARYYASQLHGQTVDVAWSYADVYDDVAALAGYIAFYSDRVNVAKN